MQNYFLNESKGANVANTTTGGENNHYWEPHTASIDFCETNYLLSGHIVEPHNVWSSLLGLSLFGLLGMLRDQPIKGELRMTITYLVLFVIGIGSAALHSTLHWVFQSSDELPMIYLVFCVVYNCLEIKSPSGNANVARYPNLHLYLFFAAIINTTIYFIFQHLFLIFFLTFSIMGGLSLFLHVQIYWEFRNLLHNSHRYPPEEVDTQRNSAVYIEHIQMVLWFFQLGVLFFLIGFGIWFVDQFGCTVLLPYYDALPFPLKGCTLHVVWHINSGIAVHCLCQFLTAARAFYLDIECEVTLVLLGTVPFVTRKKNPHSS